MITQQENSIGFRDRFGFSHGPKREREREIGNEEEKKR